jgi:hypothetical protein
MINHIPKLIPGKNGKASGDATQTITASAIVARHLAGGASSLSIAEREDDSLEEGP